MYSQAGEFTVYGSQMTDAELRTLAGIQPEADPLVPYVDDNGVLRGTLDGETLDLADHPDANSVHGSYGDDLVVAAQTGAVLNGGHGEDTIVGGPGDDNCTALPMAVSRGSIKSTILTSSIRSVKSSPAAELISRISRSRPMMCFAVDRALT